MNLGKEKCKIMATVLTVHTVFLRTQLLHSVTFFIVASLNRIHLVNLEKEKCKIIATVLTVHTVFLRTQLLHSVTFFIVAYGCFSGLSERGDRGAIPQLPLILAD